MPDDRYTYTIEAHYEAVASTRYRVTVFYEGHSIGLSWTDTKFFARRAAKRIARNHARGPITIEKKFL